MGRSFVAIDNICSEPMKPFDSPRKPSRTLWKTVLTLVLLFQASWHHRIRKATGVARLKIQLLLPKQLQGARRQGNKVLRQTQMLSQASLAFVAAPGQEDSRIGLRISSEDAAALELNTSQQSQSTTWRNSRANRLTASKFGTVLSRKASWTEWGIANIMRPKEFSNSIVRYGTLNEPRAVQRYIQSMDHIGRKVIAHTCGLMVRPASPWLGATPDRVVYDVHEDPPFGLR
ncbi:hypothetical protein MTO96_050941 [Rhipicephalus appendiculatus]